jgi:hypothetical protein
MLWAIHGKAMIKSEKTAMGIFPIRNIFKTF